MDALDEHRTAKGVVDICQRFIANLESGSVDPGELVIKKRIPKPLEAYSQATLNVAALQRYQEDGIDKRPGQDMRYVVVDDEASRTPERVRLEFEVDEEYEPAFYATELIRACESVVSPFGWDRERIRRYLRNHREVGLSAFE